MYFLVIQCHFCYLSIFFLTILICNANIEVYCKYSKIFRAAILASQITFCNERLISRYLKRPAWAGFKTVKVGRARNYVYFLRLRELCKRFVKTWIRIVSWS